MLQSTVPRGLTHCFSPVQNHPLGARPATSAVATPGPALGALPACLWRLEFSLWSGSHGTGRVIPVSGSGLRPNTSPGLIHSPAGRVPSFPRLPAMSRTEFWSCREAGQGLECCRPAGPCPGVGLSSGPALTEFSRQGCGLTQLSSETSFPKAWPQRMVILWFLGILSHALSLLVPTILPKAGRVGMTPSSTFTLRRPEWERLAVLPALCSPRSVPGLSWRRPSMMGAVMMWGCLLLSLALWESLKGLWLWAKAHPFAKACPSWLPQGDPCPTAAGNCSLSLGQLPSAPCLCLLSRQSQKLSFGTYDQPPLLFPHHRYSSPTTLSLSAWLLPGS